MTQMMTMPGLQAPVLNLQGKVGLITGIANGASIAYGAAQQFSAAGAELAVSYQNEKTRTFVEPLLQDLNAPVFELCDVTREGSLEALFQAIRTRWGRLDFVVHSMAFCSREDLWGRVTDCSLEGFQQAMDISCHSFMRMARLAEPLMTDGGTLITMSYYGAEKVVDHYGVMGVVKAALESATRYMAAELGPKGIRVHAVSPGPLKTRAGSGIAQFDKLLARAEEMAPLQQAVTIEDVGALCAFLVSDAARMMTGSTIYVDGGYHILGI